MTPDRDAGPGAAPPHVQLIQMATAYWGSRALYAAARLELADRIADGSRSSGELAAQTGAHAPSLHRLLRALAGLGIVSEDEDRGFSLTGLGQALRAGAPGAAHATVLALAGDWWWRGWEHVLHSIATGKTGMERAFGTTVFEYLAREPEEASYFNDAMIGFHGAEPEAVVAAYDFSRCETIVDIGGGTGNLLATILERHPHARGVLADRPHVLSEAAALIESRGLADRIALEPIDFFTSIPDRGDVYLLSHVIHDWTEEQCLTILRHCRAAMKPGSRLLIIEMVLPPGNTPHPGKLLDLAMLMMPGGEERTADEYAALLNRAGLEMTRVVPTASAVSVVEAVPSST
jgi:ubiquinone/menaquinone biosynthesis C-methylase UbiE